VIIYTGIFPVRDTLPPSQADRVPLQDDPQPVTV